jgi:D-alanyl-D-alanine dipeptidase
VLAPAAALLLAAAAAALPASEAGPGRRDRQTGPPASEAPPAPAPLVDAAALLPDALLDVRYATADNLTGRPLYPAARCLLLPGPAGRLVRAATRLRAQGYRLVIHDCYRPLSVQRALWAAMPRVGFVADPATGSHHNRGAAVDLSLSDAAGRPVEMPTAYDAFGPRARAGASTGIGPAALRNRRTLRAAMEAEGFRVNPAEWWHFDAPEAAGAPLLDVPLPPAPTNLPDAPSPSTPPRCSEATLRTGCGPKARSRGAAHSTVVPR